MKNSWIKRALPRSLYGRAALILVVPIVSVQLVFSVQFIQRHFAGVTEQMSRNVALEVGYVLQLIEQAPDLNSGLERVAPTLQALRLDVAPAQSGPQQDRRGLVDLSGRVVISTLRAQLPQLRALDLKGDAPWHDVARMLQLRLSTRHGDVVLLLDRSRVSASNPHQLLVLMVLISVLMTVIAFIFLRNQLRPIKRLARAAEAFGKGRSLAYKPSGANEVRAAGNAFLDMRARIERQIEQRTLMLSGVSHDLRSPLTRMKLGLSLAEDNDRTRALSRDVNDMQRMLDAFLDFARSDALDDPEPSDPVEILEAVADKARRSGGAVELGDMPEAVPMALRPLAVERAVQNLVNNALSYGDHCRLGLHVGQRMIRITVEDDGPGIPEQQRDAATKAFTRLDAARNQNRGPGVGLGLAIASDIARRHGGVLRLGESADLGGLKAELVLAR